MRVENSNENQNTNKYISFAAVLSVISLLDRDIFSYSIHTYPIIYKLGIYVLCIYILFFRLSYIIQTYDEMVWLKNYLSLQYHLIDNNLHVECVEKKTTEKNP